MRKRRNSFNSESPPAEETSTKKDKRGGGRSEGEGESPSVRRRRKRKQKKIKRRSLDGDKICRGGCEEEGILVGEGQGSISEPAEEKEKRVSLVRSSPIVTLAPPTISVDTPYTNECDGYITPLLYLLCFLSILTSLFFVLFLCLHVLFIICCSVS